MSEIGHRLRELFTEIAPPIDVEGIVETGGTPAGTRRGLVIAGAAAAVVLVTGIGSLLLVGGSDQPAETADGPSAVVDTTEGTGMVSTPVESTTTVPEDGFVPQVLRPVRVDCSSELDRFPCSALVDGDETTRWNAVEGGVGAQITLLFDEPVEITSIDLFNVGDPEAFARNARIRGLEIVFDDMPGMTAVELDDTYFQGVQVESQSTTVVALRITSAYPGQMYQGKEPFYELALAEIQVWGRLTTSTPGESTGTTPEGARAALDTTPLSGEWFGAHPDTGGLIVVTTDTIWDGEAFYVLTRLGFGDYVVWRSADGVDWEHYETIGEAGALGVSGVWSGPTEIVSVGGRLTAAGNANGRATVWVDDGSSPWRAVDVAPGAVRGLLHLDGRLVALVDSGEESAIDRRPSIWVSPDGEDWTRVAAEETFGSTSWTSQIVRGPAGLLTVGFEADPGEPEAEVSGVFVSRDGVSWSRIEPDGLDVSQVDSIVGGDFGYAVVGLGSPILASVDGVQWSPVGALPSPGPSGGSTTGQGLGVFDGRLVLVGDVDFVPEGAEFNTTQPRVWSYVGDGEWEPVGEHPWFDGLGSAYRVVTGDDAMVVLAETLVDGPEEWALLTFVNGARRGVDAGHPFHLYVSNQSFDIDPVGIEVYIDGELEISQDFEVLGQHNWILFEFDLAEGPHEIRAIARNAEAGFEESFDVTEETWAVLDFWGTEAPDGPYFDWRIQSEPVGFA